eukprot:12895678-Prorocentrum_lima.AAC.1
MYTPTGSHLAPVQEAGFEAHSCLYEAITMYLGLDNESKPITTLRRYCAEQLHTGRNIAWPRWDGMDGFGKQAPSWDAYLSSVLEEDTPAGLFELEALTHRFHLRVA